MGQEDSATDSRILCVWGGGWDRGGLSRISTHFLGRRCRCRRIFWLKEEEGEGRAQYSPLPLLAHIKGKCFHFNMLMSAWQAWSHSTIYGKPFTTDMTSAHVTQWVFTVYSVLHAYFQLLSMGDTYVGIHSLHHNGLFENIWERGLEAHTCTGTLYMWDA